MLTVGHNLIRMKDSEQHDKGYDMLIDAFTHKPCDRSAAELAIATNHHIQQKDRITQILKSYLDDFKNNRFIYSKQNDYSDKLASAMQVAHCLKQINANDPELAKEYEACLKACTDEVSSLAINATW